MFRLEHYQSILSTQELMKQKIRADEDVDKLIIRADEQTKGLGRRGRSFLSKPGGSYQTIAFKDLGGRFQKPYAAILFAISLAKEFEKKGFEVKVKWPNDLYYLDNKLGGILVEYIKNHLLVGIGINSQNELPSNAIGISLELSKINQLVELSVLKAISLFETKIKLSRLFEPYDYLYNKIITVQLSDKEITAIAKGISEKGCLVLQAERQIDVCSGHIIELRNK